MCTNIILSIVYYVLIVYTLLKNFHSGSCWSWLMGGTGLAQAWGCGPSDVGCSWGRKACLIADSERQVSCAILLSRLIRASILASIKLFGGCHKGSAFNYRKVT